MTQRIGTARLLRRAATGATAVLAATTLLAGCGSDANGPEGPSASPSADPKAALLASVPDEQDPAFRVGGTDETGTAIAGLVDPAAKGTELTVTERDAKAGFTMKLSFRVIDERSWMKVSFTGADELTSLLKLPKNWMELDESKIEDPEGVPGYEGPDPGNARVIISNASGVAQQADGTYAGTVDLTAEDTKEAMEVDLAALGDQAKAVPFTGTVGPDGNLAALQVMIPAAGKTSATTYSVKYYDFGTAPKLTAPTGDDVRAAPASAYEMLNS